MGCRNNENADEEKQLLPGSSWRSPRSTPKNLYPASRYHSVMNAAQTEVSYLWKTWMPLERHDNLSQPRASRLSLCYKNAQGSFHREPGVMI